MAPGEPGEGPARAQSRSPGKRKVPGAAGHRVLLRLAALAAVHVGRAAVAGVVAHRAAGVALEGEVFPDEVEPGRALALALALRAVGAGGLRGLVAASHWHFS